jgi:phosphate transport system permease protein
MSATMAATASGVLAPEAIAARRDVVRQSSRDTLARRRLHGRVIQLACVLALLIALVPVVTLLAYTVSRGVSGLSVAFFTQLPAPPDVPGIPPGGISNAIVGTLIIVGLAVAMAVPVGLAVAVFLMERQGKLAATIRFVADVMTGIPSIAIGAFAYALIVVPSHTASGISGSFALAVLMLPIIIFTVLGGTLLMATNPLRSMAAMPLTILNDGTQPQSSVQTTAWATALVLLLFVLVLSVVGRVVASRLTRHAR